MSANVTDVERAVAQTIPVTAASTSLINNAGIIQVGPLDHMQLSDYDDAMKTHFWGPLFMVLAVLPHMRLSGRWTDRQYLVDRRPRLPYRTWCRIRRASLRSTGLSDGLRAELARENIIVTTVCPGLMRIGSPINAAFKGQRAQEYSWFAISSSLPVTTISAERAASQILDACRRGDG